MFKTHATQTYSNDADWALITETVKTFEEMTSGHAGLVSALTAAGIGPGDQVIVSAYTYIASPMAVVAEGAIPVITEIDESLTIDPEDIERKITPHKGYYAGAYARYALQNGRNLQDCREVRIKSYRGSLPSVRRNLQGSSSWNLG